MDIQKQLDAEFATIIFKQDNFSYAIGSNKFLVADWKANILHTYDYKDLQINAAAEIGNGFISGSEEQQFSKAEIETGTKHYLLDEDSKGNLTDFINQLNKKKSSLSY
ncbi:hypothetical protein [Paenibacillus agricola]|uniref:YokE-like PH domain-containing protein n=1 Tax=Paenibacillus agricola TaxID=2716264 RepID=A0ABX0JF52_9BACL|nr:hypothetical protein [Paenibacillus agricola]NHN33522.1 hypothetical protein [Paenibacillus agricola]